jgi:hypothetical protein
MNVLLGVAYGWWINHHNRHHSSPNNLDVHPDTAGLPVIFHVDELPIKARTPFRRFIIRFQSVMFFVLLGQTAYQLRSASVKAAMRGTLKWPKLDISLGGGAFRRLIFRVVQRVAGQGGSVFPGALDAVRIVPRRGVRPEPQGNASVSERRRTGLAAPSGADLTRGVFRSVHRFRVRRTQLPDRASPVPWHARVNLRRARPIVKQYCAAHGIPCEKTPV